MLACATAIIGAPALTQAAVTTPELAYSSYLGGNSDETGRGIVRDSAGNIYIVGETYSTDFGGTPNKIAGSSDTFVAKYDPTGKKLLYKTILGGKESDNGIAIAVNAAGEVALTVNTMSPDFPLKNPLLDTYPENGGALVKLDAAGNVVFSTFLNVEFYDTAQNVAFDGAGNIYITGMYWAGGTEGRENVALFSFSPDGQTPIALQHFGGDWFDKGVALTVAPDGTAYIAGETEFREGGFPLSDTAFQQVCGAKSYGANDNFCDMDAFVAVVTPDGKIPYATYLGGKGTEDVYGIGRDNAGNIYVAGTTAAQNFPTKQAFQGTWLGADNFSNGFITKFTPDLSQQVYSTYLSSEDQFGSEYIYGMFVDGDGSVAVTGLTNGEKFPLKNALQKELDGTICLGDAERYCYDGYVSAFDANGALTFSSYLGAHDDDSGYAITGDGAGGVWVTGNTEASDFAVTADAAQPTSMMQSDAFLTHLGKKSGGGENPPPAGKYRSYAPLLQR